jgi:hypothetical protein
MAFNDWYFFDSDNFPSLTSTMRALAIPVKFKPEDAIAGFSQGLFELNPYRTGATNDLFKVELIAGKSYDIYSTSFYDPDSLLIYDSSGKGLAFNSENNDRPDLLLSGAYYSKDDIFDWTAPYSGTYYIDAGWNPGIYNTYNFLQILENLGVSNPPPKIKTAANLLPGGLISLSENIAIGFDQTVRLYTQKIKLVDSKGIVIPITTNLPFADVLVLDPSVDLKPGETYKLEIPVGAVVNLGGRTNEKATYEFTAPLKPAAGAGKDLFTPTAWDKEWDGGGNIDTVVMAGFLSNYNISGTLAERSINDNRFADSSLNFKAQNVERIHFKNVKLAFDIDGNAGKSMGFIGVIAPSLLGDSATRGVILGLFDSGKTMEELTKLALELNLVPQTNTDLVNTIYRNVTGGVASQEMTQTLIGYIESHSQANFLATVADMHINVDLVGLAKSGVEFI